MSQPYRPANGPEVEMNKDKTILHLCADIGSDSQPYRDAGYNVICVGKDQDVRTYKPPDYVYGIIANPPCTEFSFAATNPKSGPRDFDGALSIIRGCLRVIWECQTRIESRAQKRPPLKFWMLENPQGMLEWFLGKPAARYNPYEFGEVYQKRTCLWGQFNMPEPSGIKHPKPKKFDKLLTHEIAPEYRGKLTRQERRSVCSANFAKAFFEANI